MMATGRSLVIHLECGDASTWIFAEQLAKSDQLAPETISDNAATRLWPPTKM
jgi:hypothetical protein